MSWNIVVVGQSRHGKDEFAAMLAQELKTTYSSSSWEANKLFIYQRLKDKHKYTSLEECYNDRDNYRELWYRLIVEFNTPDPTRLAKHIFNKHGIYCGMRSRRELLACKFSKLVNCTIWVDASQRVPHRDTVKHNTITQKDADLYVDNNGTLDDLRKEAQHTAKILEILKIRV